MLQVERANGYHVFAQSHGTVSSRRRALSGRAMELGNGRESFLGAHQSCSYLNSLTQASSSHGRRDFVSGEPWSTVRMEQRTFGGILCLLRSDSKSSLA